MHRRQLKKCATFQSRSMAARLPVVYYGSILHVRDQAVGTSSLSQGTFTAHAMHSCKSANEGWVPQINCPHNSTGNASQETGSGNFATKSRVSCCMCIGNDVCRFDAVPPAVTVDHTMIELVQTRGRMVLGAGVSAFWGSEGRVPCMPEVEVEFRTQRNKSRTRRRIRTKMRTPIQQLDQESRKVGQRRPVHG